MAWKRPQVVGRVGTTVTYLETTEPPKGPPVQPPNGAEIVRVLEPGVAFWRFLYDTIGEAWVWTEGRLKDDAEILAFLRAPGRDMRVLWHHGSPAGLVVFDFADPADVEIKFFGLLPDHTGRGLGRYLLDWAVRHAFAKGAARIWLHTCDLDHPRALANYEARGFVAYDREEDEVPVLADTVLPAHVADRPVRPPDPA